MINEITQKDGCLDIFRDSVCDISKKMLKRDREWVKYKLTRYRL